MRFLLFIYDKGVSVTPKSHSVSPKMSVEISVGNVVIKPVVPRYEQLLETSPMIRKKRNVDDKELKNILSNLVENLNDNDDDDGCRKATRKIESYKSTAEEEIVRG